VIEYPGAARLFEERLRTDIQQNDHQHHGSDYDLHAD
jgi:hypothetical protein